MLGIPTTKNDRLAWVDAVRGVAILLMVLDHVLVQVDPGSPVRLTLTRLSLPLFMVAAARVFRRRPGGRRLLQLLAAAAAEIYLFAILGMQQPGILFVYTVLVVCGVFTVGARYPWSVGALGLVQALYLPLPGLDGYQPGLVALWWCLGRLSCDELEPVYSRAPRFTAVVGRRPLTWYVGHLVVIVGATLVL